MCLFLLSACRGDPPALSAGECEGGAPGPQPDGKVGLARNLDWQGGGALRALGLVMITSAPAAGPFRDLDLSAWLGEGR